MNILTIIVLLLLIILTLNGYRKGFIKVFASMSFFILAAVLVYFANPYVSQFLKSHTPIYSAIEKQCEELLQIENEKIEVNDKKAAEQKSEKSVIKEDQKQLIDGLPVPQIIKDQLGAMNIENQPAILDTSAFTGYIVSYLADLILNVLSFVVTVLLITVVLRVSVMTLNIVASLPVLNGANRVLGLVLGFGQGIITIWFAFLIITIFSQSEMGKQLLTMINESIVLSYIYDYNILLKFLL